MKNNEIMININNTIEYEYMNSIIFNNVINNN